MAGTRKFRNVRAGNHAVALVVDDLVAFDPFVARGVRIYGRAGQPVERDGLTGPGLYLTPGCRASAARSDLGADPR